MPQKLSFASDFAMEDTQSYNEQTPLLQQAEDSTMSGIGEHTILQMNTSPHLHPRQKISSQLGESIITSFISVCCPVVLPFSLVAIYFSSKSTEQSSTQKATLYALIAKVLWIGSLIVSIISYFFFFFVLFSLLRPL